MSAGRLGFAIVGCGRIGATHAAAIGAIPGARLVAVADVDEARARAFGAEHGVEGMDVDRAVGRPDVDVVCVCTPSGEHAAAGVEAARAGKHVVVEKPIDITLEAADRLIGACRDAGVRLCVIFQYRWHDGVRKARELVAAGRLGTQVMGEASMKLYRSQAYYDSAGWRGSWAVDGGGALMNQGVHYVDLLQWLMGPVRGVDARMSTAAHTVETEDVVAALLEFESGAQGVLQATTAAYPGLYERLEVMGTGGTVVVEDGVLVVRELKDERGEAPPYGRQDGLVGRAPLSEASATGFEGHRRQLAELVDDLRAGRDPLVTGEEGRKALEIILAVYESGRSGRRVRLGAGSGGA